MFSHERDYSEENSFPRNTQGHIRQKNSDQPKVEEKLDHPPLVPRFSACLLRERKQFGICIRGAVLCDNRGDISLANSHSRWRVTTVLPEHTRLSAAEPGISDADQGADVQNKGCALKTTRFQQIFATRKSRQQARRV
jgi:hypothetical protein